MLSIAIFTYSTKPRGSVVHATSLAEALTRSGHDVTVYALAKPGASLYRPLACAVDLIPAGEAPPDMDALIRQRIAEFVSGFRSRDMRHDLFHAQDCLAGSALVAARSSRVTPIVRTVHHVERFESPFLAQCQRRSILEADAVFSVSRLTQRSVLEEFGRASAVVHNGVDRARFEQADRSTHAPILARFGIDAADLVVLSVGGVEPRKNMRRALAAFAKVHARHPRLWWIIAGGHSIWDHSEYRAGFDADLAQLPEELARRIIRTGVLSEEDITALYRSSDVLLCPSEQEGFGLCVLEAMAAGAAVVVPGREPFTEYVDESSAVFVDSDSVESIANGLANVIADAGVRERLTAAAERRIADFTWRRSAAAHLALYEAIGRPVTHADPRWADV
jgi:glycosyltransferase-like protein